MLSAEFLAGFKHATEARWSTRPINSALYGFQTQRGTRWNPGLSENEIAQYDAVLAIRFLIDLRAFLKAMNGTDLPTLNIYGSSGEPARRSVGVYAFPRDLAVVRQCAQRWDEDRDALAATLSREGFDLPANAGLLAIYAHRCVVCGKDPERSVVLSIAHEHDAIVYATSLEEYLLKEFLSR